MNSSNVPTAGYSTSSAWKTVEVALLALLFLSTVVVLVIRGTRFAAVLAVRTLFFAAVVVDIACYVLGEVGVL